MPSEFGFEPRSPRYGPFSVSGLVDTKCAQSVPFLAIFGPFLGHIVELEGNERLFVTGQSRRMSAVGTVCHRLAVLNGYQGCFGAQNAQFWEGTSRLDPPLPWGANGEFLTQNLDLARPPPRE